MLMLLMKMMKMKKIDMNMNINMKKGEFIKGHPQKQKHMWNDTMQGNACHFE